MSFDRRRLLVLAFVGALAFTNPATAADPFDRPVPTSWWSALWAWATGLDSRGSRANSPTLESNVLGSGGGRDPNGAENPTPVPPAPQQVNEDSADEVN